MTYPTMPIENMDDWELRLKRQEAFFECAIIDRPVVWACVPREKPIITPPPDNYNTRREMWLDIDYRAKAQEASVLNTEWLGDALPYAWPNLGPDLFSACCGGELEFGDITSWSIHEMSDISEWPKYRFSEDNSYWKKTVELTDALMEIGKGNFYTSITDLHAGADAIAAFRSAQNLCMDLLISPEEVKAFLERVTDVYLWMADFFIDKFVAAGHPVIDINIASRSRWRILVNDFSYMISTKAYEEIFYGEMIRESEHLDATVYHLDGIGALPHLDLILQIPNMKAVQWVYGSPPYGAVAQQIPVLKKIQAAGKGLQLFLTPADVDVVIENLRPEGTWNLLVEHPNKDAVESTLAKMRKWK